LRPSCAHVLTRHERLVLTSPATQRGHPIIC